MLESLIILLCIGDYSCGEAVRAYSKTPTGIEYNNNAKKLAQKYVSKEQMITMGMFISAATNGKAKLRLYRGFTFEGNRDQVELIYKYNF